MLDQTKQHILFIITVYRYNRDRYNRVRLYSKLQPA